MKRSDREWLADQFRIDIQTYGILDALNRTCYNIAELKTFPFTEERENAIDRYIKRKKKIVRFKKKFNIK